MQTIASLLEKFQNLDTDKIIEEAFEESTEDFAAENRDQMMHGLDRNEQRIGRYKNNRYAKKKNQLNALPGYGNIDLRLDGPYQNKIEIKVSGEIVEERSTDEKAEYIEANYGTDMYGLGGEFKAEFLDESLEPKVQEKISEVIGLPFG